MRRLSLTLAVVLIALGLITSTASADPASKFVPLFPQLKGFDTPTNQQIADLAGSMLDPNADSENNPDMTSVFTYFGQFIDHDLTLDISPSPLAPVNVATLDKNARTFRFDLDSVYGQGPDGSPELFEADHKHFRVQNPNPNGVVDLPRTADGTAILVEGRNDENEIISQIHVAFLLVHNKLVDSGLSYDDAHRRTVSLYQHLVLNEYLPHVVGQPTLDGLRNGSIERVYKPGNPNANKTPVEFSVAAFRFGHSQVRRAYELTNTTGKIQVFDLGGAPDLRGGRQLPGGRQIDWGNFVSELTRPDNVAHLNVSRKIDTLISRSLFQLPIPGVEATGSNVLAFRNMVRSDAYDMPSGQEVAAKLGIPVIPPADLHAGPGFENGTPLWYYILAESSRAADGKTLGPVGGRIVGDVLLSLLENDPDGIITHPFTPGAPEAGPGGRFDFGDLFTFAGLATRP